ncbi:MAG TPA: DUF6364 family protein [Chryseolinea sp.]|nr:DUF6364 family protein [Chryseolinea sp.]
MDAKITLSFDEKVIQKAKKFAKANNISLSRLTEYLFSKITHGQYQQLEDIPVAEWIKNLAEGEIIYRSKERSRKSLKQAYFKSRK